MNIDLQKIDLYEIYFFIMLAALALSILLIRYTVNLNRYLKEFAAVSKKVSNKEFHTRVDTSIKGELGELSKNFNYMIQIMDDTIEELNYKHLQLKSVVKSVSHGIIAIDIRGRILIINDIAKYMVKSKKDMNVEGLHYRRVIGDKKILNIFQKCIGSNQNEIREVNLDDDLVYRIKIDPVYFQDSKHAIIGSIINIEDITEIVKLENMRRDFVANVSHELKTPLTSIAGFVETLRMNEDIDKDTRNHFLEIIEKESNRLKGLIEDILMLSSIENGQNLHYENVVVAEVFEEVYEMTQKSAISKNIEVVYKCEYRDARVKASRDNIKQIILNLLDNAIKYTPNDGKINVRQYSNREKDELVLEFKDTGIGIPKEDLDRIFERFYRVDKARSRAIGGTGLGLAIIKHLVKGLGGNIKVESVLGKGSKFTVSLPTGNKEI